MNHATILPLLFCAFFAVAARGASFDVLPAGRLPDDIRLQPVKDLDGYFPFTPPKSRETWEPRAQELRRQLLVALGLWPMPDKTPLNPVIHGKIDRGDYTVEKVYFESMPGFFVSGSLYRPKGRSGRLPAVLNPHGHWADGRFYDNAGGIAQEIADGAERFSDSGRSPLQARCVQLARMGCVAFFYDMIGYADSQQIPMAIAHTFAKQRPEMNTVENWGLFSPQAEAHAQSVMGLQTFNSIRALDFLCSLPDVDPERIAVTGASGGGTQTFILCALDPRPKVAFPAVMVSTAMQGGCTCENASLLRVDTGNVEIAALFAPKPLGLTAANDWTKEMAAKGFPELKQHYAMLGAPDHVSLKAAIHFGHNYNHVSRAAMYNWVNRHLALGLQEPVIEEDYKRLTAAELTVWDDAHPKPPGGPEFERKLLRHWHDDSEKRLATAAASPAAFRELASPALQAIIGRSLSSAGAAEFEVIGKTEIDGRWEITGLLKNTTHHEQLPAVFLHPKESNGRTVIWLAENGKEGLRDGGALRSEVEALLRGGSTVVGVDLLFQGEFLADGKPVAATRRVKNPREAAAFTFGYNHTLLAQRVHDLFTLLSFIQNHERKSQSIDLIALDQTAPAALLARALAGPVIRRLAVNTGGFRFGKLLEIHAPNFLPAAAKYGDLPGLLALGAPAETWLTGEPNPDFAGQKIPALTASADPSAKVATQWLAR